MMKKIFIISVISVFWTLASIDAAFETKIQQELGTIDNLTNLIYGNIAGMKETIAKLVEENTGLKAENTGLREENTRLKSDNSNVASKGMQASNARGTGAASLTQNTNMLLDIILKNLHIISQKLDTTEKAANEGFQAIPKGNPLQKLYVNIFEKAKSTSAHQQLLPLPQSQRGQLMAEINQRGSNQTP